MIYTEITPNPASLKFVITDRVVMPHGTADFRDVEDTADAPLAKKIYDFKFVEGVFLGRNFVTITKSPDFQWEEVIPAVKDFLKSFIASGQDLVTGKFAEAPVVPEGGAFGADDDDVVSRIKALLESHVRPAVAQDGGDIIYQDFEDGVVKLKLQGSCSGCPSSVMTLKGGIENLLMHHIREVKSVEAV